MYWSKSRTDFSVSANCWFCRNISVLFVFQSDYHQPLFGPEHDYSKQATTFHKSNPLKPAQDALAILSFPNHPKIFNYLISINNTWLVLRYFRRTTLVLNCCQHIKTWRRENGYLKAIFLGLLFTLSRYSIWENISLHCSVDCISKVSVLVWLQI